MFSLASILSPKNSTIHTEISAPPSPPPSIFSLKSAIFGRTTSEESLSGRVTPYSPISQNASEQIENKIFNLEDEYELTKKLLFSMSKEVTTISSKIDENKEKLIPLKTAFLTNLQSLSDQGLTLFITESDKELLEKIHTSGKEHLSDEEKDIISNLYAKNSIKFVAINTEFPFDISVIFSTLDIHKKVIAIENEIETDMHHLFLLKGEGHSGCITSLIDTIVGVDASPNSVMGTTYKKLDDINSAQLELYNTQLTIDD